MFTESGLGTNLLLHYKSVPWQVIVLRKMPSITVIRECPAIRLILSENKIVQTLSVYEDLCLL